MDLNHPNRRYSYYSLRSTFHASLCLISYSANFGLPSNVRYRGLTTRQEFMSALAHYGLTIPDLRVAKAFAPSKVSRFYTVVSVLSRSFIRVNLSNVTVFGVILDLCYHASLSGRQSSWWFILMCCTPVSAGYAFELVINDRIRTCTHSRAYHLNLHVPRVKNQKRLSIQNWFNSLPLKR